MEHGLLKGARLQSCSVLNERPLNDGVGHHTNQSPGGWTQILLAYDLKARFLALQVATSESRDERTELAVLR